MKKRRLQHSLYECTDFWLLAPSRARYIESRDLVLADELEERDLRRNSSLIEMQPWLVVFDDEVDRFLRAASRCRRKRKDDAAI